MQIDWKRLATTPGYKSLKAAYVRDVQEERKNKKRLQSKFQWVINRAKHYSYRTGKSIENVLNEWEKKRSYWWLNYYQDCKQPILHSGSIKKKGINGEKKEK